jgi:hypothetical protein
MGSAFDRQYQAYRHALPFREINRQLGMNDFAAASMPPPTPLLEAADDDKFRRLV